MRQPSSHYFLCMEKCICVGKGGSVESKIFKGSTFVSSICLLFSSIQKSEAKVKLSQKKDNLYIQNVQRTVFS